MEKRGECEDTIDFLFFMEAPNKYYVNNCKNEDQHIAAEILQNIRRSEQKSSSDVRFLPLAWFTRRVTVTFWYPP